MPADVVVDGQASAVQPAAKAFATLVHEIAEAMQECVQLAQACMAAQANKYHHNVKFAVHDQVLLDTRTINLVGSKKFNAHFVGPF